MRINKILHLFTKIRDKYHCVTLERMLFLVTSRSTAEQMAEWTYFTRLKVMRQFGVKYNLSPKAQSSSPTD
jgi:hypothetical protein